MKIPVSPREPDIIERSFSGRVVARERRVVPRREVERVRRVERVVREWERM